MKFLQVFHTKIQNRNIRFPENYNLKFKKSKSTKEDKMCWKPSRDKEFKVNDYYRVLGALLTSVFLGKAFGNRRFLLE